MKFAVLASLIACAAAFTSAPAKTAVRNRSTAFWAIVSHASIGLDADSLFLCILIFAVHQQVGTEHGEIQVCCKICPVHSAK